VSPADQLDQGIDALGLDLAPDARAQLLAYLALLQKWNRVYNLTALREPAQIVSHHLLDALSILPAVTPSPIADIGAGGGVPGLVLAIARPDLPVTLVDSNSKKGAFLRQVAIELGLANVTVEIGRVEVWQPATRFSQITSRAFAELADFVGWTRHLLAPGGVWLAMKGLVPAAEIANLPADIVVAAIRPLNVPGVDGARHLVTLGEA
jgi:16S rRNA (guanine527-N7)-methyltransferase